MLHLLFGNLTIASFIHNWIVMVADGFMVVVGLVVLGLMTYFKKWKWLWTEWLTTLDHKKIGVMYLIVAAVMLLKGGIDALMMRAQQAFAAGPNYGYLTANHFNQIFSAHGVTMIFFVAMPLIFGLFNLIIPLQIGSRDVAFPFLNSVSFWMFVAGVALFDVSLVIGHFSSAGWLAYPPLSELAYSPGVGVDYWIWCLQLAGIGSLLSAINFFVTIIKLRAPGMTLMKMPMFIWNALASIILMIFAFPVLTATLGMLWLDRFVGMHFFTAGFGGNAMMYVNLIWTWGHPEVYILVLPAFGIFSEVVSTFSRKRIFGYVSMVCATASILILSFLVWLHHFFTMGASANVNAFFGIMTMIIAVPTGVKIFNWIFTMYHGRVRFFTPMWWFFGFIGLFTMGGMAGVLMAVPAADFQLHNSLFLVAHFHTMIVSGVLFGLFAGFTYWFPKYTGFRLSEAIGKWAFWGWLVGFVVAFGPLYILGFMGATRRLYHYASSTGFQPLFIVAAVGACIIALGGMTQVVQIIQSWRRRRELVDRTAGDPWDGRTLEWMVHTPVPVYNFAVIPSVDDSEPLWKLKKEGEFPSVLHDPSARNAPKVTYEDIFLPKNSAVGLIIGAFGFMFGFAAVWHIYWLMPVSFLVIVGALIARAFNDETEYCIPAAEVERMEKAYMARRIAAATAVTAASATGNGSATAVIEPTQ